MKRLFIFFTLIVCLLSACTKARDQMGFISDGSNSTITAIVTVRQDADSQVYFQVSENICLYPVNYKEPFTGPCRIICEIQIDSERKSCSVIWMDYLQEGTVQNTPPGKGDGVDILDDWMTCLEDGYLTLHYFTLWGDGSVPHTLTLVTGENPEDPYEVRLVHQSNGDAPLEEGDALIYFDLKDLPPTGENGQTLTLKWTNKAGNEIRRSFFFKSRQ